MGPSPPAAGGLPNSLAAPAVADPAALLGLKQAHINSLMQNWLAVYTAPLHPQGLTDHEIAKLAFEKALQEARSSSSGGSSTIQTMLPSLPGVGMGTTAAASKASQLSRL